MFSVHLDRLHPPLAHLERKSNAPSPGTAGMAILRQKHDVKKKKKCGTVLLGKTITCLLKKNLKNAKMKVLL